MVARDNSPPRASAGPRFFGRSNHSTTSRAWRTALSAPRKDRAISISAAGLALFRRSQRLSASHAISAPSWWRSRTINQRALGRVEAKGQTVPDLDHPPAEVESVGLLVTQKAVGKSLRLTSQPLDPGRARREPLTHQIPPIVGRIWLQERYRIFLVRSTLPGVIWKTASTIVGKSECCPCACSSGPSPRAQRQVPQSFL